jgi:hypothetical protein
MRRDELIQLDQTMELEEVVHGQALRMLKGLWDVFFGSADPTELLSLN